MTWVFIFQKQWEKIKHLKLTYLSNYLNKMKQKNKYKIEDEIIQKKIDQIMVDDVYL
jgi:CRISPR/Cas system-associated endonuclease/helicase Cas3